MYLLYVVFSFLSYNLLQFCQIKSKKIKLIVKPLIKQVPTITDLWLGLATCCMNQITHRPTNRLMHTSPRTDERLGPRTGIHYAYAHGIGLLQEVFNAFIDDFRLIFSKKFSFLFQGPLGDPGWKRLTPWSSWNLSNNDFPLLRLP